jgi:hypothetical protein
VTVARAAAVTCARSPSTVARDRLATAEVADDRPVALVAPPCPLADPDDQWRFETRTAAPSHNAQERVIADRHHQATSKIRCRSTAKSKREMMLDLVEPSGSLRPWQPLLPFRLQFDEPEMTSLWSLPGPHSAQALNNGRLDVHEAALTLHWATGARPGARSDDGFRARIRRPVCRCSA